MTFSYETLTREYHEAYRNWRYAQHAMDEKVGNRLRAHQHVALSVMAKANGRCAPSKDEAVFHRGNGAWAWALRSGFEVIAVDSEKITVRAIVKPGDNVTPATYGLPVALLTMSDRQFASELRASIAESKERRRAHEAFFQRRAAAKRERAIASKRRELEELVATHTALSSH